jgi:DNA-binding LacI/PurR family transcriptional regulator
LQRKKLTKPTLKDIAELTHLSVSTVSRAINDDPVVSFETKNTVKKIARELGYNCASMSKDLRSISLVMPDPVGYALRNPYFTEIIRGVYAVFREFPQTRVTLDDFTTFEVVRSRIQGAILVSPDDVHFDLTQVGTLPTVIIDSLGNGGQMSIVSDNTAGMMMATEHVLVFGHRAIAYAGPRTTSSGKARYEGFIRALSKYQIEMAEPNWVVTTAGSSFQDGYAACASLLELDNKPTAILAFNDFMAWGMLAFCQSQGIQVPDELSIVGYDGTSQLPPMSLVHLTTVDQHAFQQGYTAGNSLIGLLSGQSLSVDSISISPTVVVGNTVRHPVSLRVTQEV